MKNDNFLVFEQKLLWTNFYNRLILFLVIVPFQVPISIKCFHIRGRIRSSDQKNFNKGTLDLFSTSRKFIAEPRSFFSSPNKLSNSLNGHGILSADFFKIIARVLISCLSKKRLQHSCFLVKFAKSLRTPFL